MSHCGECTACCKTMGVPEFAKPRDKWCHACAKGKGCTVYAARPPSCVDFECMWLQSQLRFETPMRANLRPDKCKVILVPTGDRGLCVHVDEAYPTAWQEGGMGEMLRSLVARGLVLVVAIGKRRFIFDRHGKTNEVLDEGDKDIDMVLHPDRTVSLRVKGPLGKGETSV